MRAKLTKQVVDRTRPERANVFMWDRELPGFGLKVTPARRKVFVFQYRQRSSPRRVTIGPYGPLTVEDARAAARRLAGRVAAGEDPAGERAEARLASKDATVVKLSAAYLDELSARARPTSAYECRRIFDRYVIPALGSKPVAALSLRDLSALHIAHRARPVMANRIVTTLRAFLNWCERHGYRPRGSNPCCDVERFAERARERFLSPAEVARLGAALKQAELEGLPPAPALRRQSKRVAVAAKPRPKSWGPVPANPFAVAAIRFLACSGWREQEALTLRWQDVDLGRGQATLGTTKTGRSQRRLGPPAIALLASLPRIDESPYVFPGRELNRPLREIKRVWTAARHAAGLDDVRLHDLRHSFASFAVGSGLSLYLTGQLLGHKQAATTQRYAHFADDVLKAAADDVSNTIWAHMQGVRTPKVRPMRSAAR